MFDIGGGELVVIILAVILLFGPKKIPDFMKMFGKGLRKIKDAKFELKQQINNIEREIETPIKEIKDKIEE